MEDERRRTPDCHSLQPLRSSKRGHKLGIAARVTELSLYGCYVEMSNPLAKGTQALLKVYSEGRYFETQGIVAYSQPDQGHGRRLPECESALFDRFETVAHRGRPGEIWEEGTKTSLSARPAIIRTYLRCAQAKPSGPFPVAILPTTSSVFKSITATAFSPLSAT